MEKKRIADKIGRRCPNFTHPSDGLSDAQSTIDSASEKGLLRKGKRGGWLSNLSRNPELFAEAEHSEGVGGHFRGNERGQLECIINNCVKLTK